MNEIRRPVCLGKEVVRRPVDEISVRLVENEGDVPRLREDREPGNEFARVDRACRVVWRDEDDRARPVRDQVDAIFRRREKVGSVAGQRHKRQAELLERHLVVEVPRGRENDLVARLGEGEHRSIESLYSRGAG